MFASKILQVTIGITVLTTFAAFTQSQPTKVLENKHIGLEEVIVTAQKREQSIQNAPLAISVISAEQLNIQGIHHLGALGDGAVPSLRVQPYANTPSTLNIAIRGNGPTDVGQITRDYPVAIYLDGVYLGRAQGLGMDFADLQRIEVLRGPQGTLFGRNATAGAVRLISKKPSGEFGIKQTLGTGRYHEFRSATLVNLPMYSGVSTKLSYIHSQRDGWVENSARGQSNYNEYDKDGTRFSLNWKANEVLNIDYVYDLSKIEAAQNYLQLYEDRIGIIKAEPRRQTKTRFPIPYLKPTKTNHEGHKTILKWDLSEKLTLTSLSAYRQLEEEVNNNYAGVFYFNGLSFQEDIDQEQFSQEFQLIGTHKNVEWNSGLYYYDEDTKNDQQNIFTLDSFGAITGTINKPITPTNIYTSPLGVQTIHLPQRVDVNSQSLAIYGQATWTPTVLGEQLHLTLGARFTEDKKSGTRTQFVTRSFRQDWESLDSSLTLNYEWSENLSTYIKWGTAYKSGGVSLRSTSFAPYDKEEVETFEVGFKSELWDRRIRLNAAIFATDYDNMQIDFADPSIITTVETINAKKTVKVDGIEFDLTAAPLERMLIGLNYTYLDGDMPLQPNPLSPGSFSVFELTQTPQHAGALSLNYTFQPLRIGTLAAHLSITSTDQYAYLPVGFQRFDAYTLFNARITLADIDVGKSNGALKLSLWGKNLSDEQYVVYAAPVSTPFITVTQVFGTPRTLGLDIEFEI